MIVTHLPEFRFEGKARTLAHLSDLLTTGKVLPLVRFTVVDWARNPSEQLKLINRELGLEKLIVRSSCRSEDQADVSGAGAYMSVSNVNGYEQVENAIQEVITSYPVNSSDDDVLIQRMAAGVTACGVVMTRDPESGLPYYVVDYTVGSSTDSVTAGNGQVLSWISVKNADLPEPDCLAGLLPMIREVESLTGHHALDIEFAMTEDGPILFQVRPMTAVKPQENEADFYAELKAAGSVLEDVGRLAKFNQRGKLAQFGLMPDWNPAEIIGVKPRPLAFDLYRVLITNLNWASARFRYGYRDLRGHRLMQRIGGSPYISIPLSVESFIPAAMPQQVVDSVVASSCQHLALAPELHDKIEFSIIPTCFTPTLTIENASKLPAFKGLTVEQIALYLKELRTLTENIISEDGPFFNDVRLIPRIEQTLTELKCSATIETDPLQHFRTALSYASVVGEMFAGAARAAFVATSILKTLEKEGITPAGHTDVFLGRAKTVGQELSEDFYLLDQHSFLQKHGHIRPGTYDIRIARYDENPELYFDWSEAPIRQPKSLNSSPEDRELNLKIQKAFYRSGMDIHVKQFSSFCLRAVEAREKVKYLYGAFVSEVLKSLTLWGRLNRIDRDILSFVSLNVFSKEETSTGVHVRESAIENKTRWQASLGIRPPTIIVDRSDILTHEIMVMRPNFITSQRADAPIKVLKSGQVDNGDLAGTIVIIENADPGFDWIFTRKIAGFITAYGGENSHMSIRAREFGIPAVIGVGEAQLNRFAKAKRLLIDCAANRIEILV